MRTKCAWCLTELNIPDDKQISYCLGYANHGLEPLNKREGFSSGRIQIATEDDLCRSWNGIPDGGDFYCKLCGYKFAKGDYYRWIYSNSTPGAPCNFFTCKKCDGPDVLKEAVEQYKIAKRWLGKHE